MAATHSSSLSYSTFPLLLTLITHLLPYITNSNNRLLTICQMGHLWQKLCKKCETRFISHFYTILATAIIVLKWHYLIDNGYQPTTISFLISIIQSMSWQVCSKSIRTEMQIYYHKWSKIRELGDFFKRAWFCHSSIVDQMIHCSRKPANHNICISKIFSQK